VEKRIDEENPPNRLLTIKINVGGKPIRRPHRERGWSRKKKNGKSLKDQAVDVSLLAGLGEPRTPMPGRGPAPEKKDIIQGHPASYES